jgi:hypothetical protein
VQIAALRARAEQAEADAAALRAATVHALRALDLVHDEDRLREHLTAALATDAGADLLTDLAELRAWRNAMQEFVRTLILETGAADVPLPVAIARLQTELAAARRVAEAVAVLILGTGRVAEVRAAGDAYLAFLKEVSG